MTTTRTVEFINQFSSRYLIDTLGFEKHMRQIRKRRGDTIPAIWYKRPAMYGLYLETDKVVGNNEILNIPSFVAKPDYEFEIVAFFTESIKTTSVEVATEFVRTKMRFTIFNDMSARDYQAEDMLLPLWVGPSKGILPKSFGPKWVDSSELSFDKNGVLDMQMTLSVNNELRCDTNFQSIYFFDPETGEQKCWGPAQVIAWFGKRDQGFEKGHMLGSGTIGNGCIAEFAAKIDNNGNETEPAKYPWLKDGDVILMEAEGIGILKNTIKIDGAL